jgi:hypothetical protein
MSGKRYVLTAVALALLAAAGCSSSSSSSEPSTGAGSSTPIASSSAIASAKAEATACIQKTGTNGLLTSSGRTELVNCLKGIVSPAEQQAFKNCVTSAAVNDKVWTGDGRSKFINTSVPGCLDTAASATASPT